MGQLSPPTWLIDTKENCLVYFFHAGPIENHVHQLGPFPSPNGHWVVSSLKVGEGNRALSDGGDWVNVHGGSKVQHTAKPDGPAHNNDAAVGSEAEFGGPGINAAAFPQGGSLTRSLTVAHPNAHQDLFSVVLTVAVRSDDQGNPTADIKNYRISIHGDHQGAPVADKKGNGERREPRTTKHRY